MSGVLPWYAVCRQGLRRAGHRHIPPLRQHPGIEQEGLADAVFTRGLMNMARDTEVRLIGFDEGAHAVTAHMRASVNAVNRRLIGWTVRHENFIARLFDQVIAGKQIVGDLLLTELRRRIKWRVVRAPNPEDTYLTEAVLMLDPSARIDAVPALEIRTNDVKASHSATVSRVTPEDLFYLQSRGLPERSARTMFVDGFLRDLAHRIEEPTALTLIQRVLEGAR